MKIFIYKTFVVILSAYLLFQLTFGQIFRNYERMLENIMHDDQGREQVLSKIKEEIRAANQKENLFTSEEQELLSNFINKIKKELSIDKIE
jgi:aspartate/glutamate racemase